MTPENRHEARVATVIAIMLLIGAGYTGVTEGGRTTWEAIEFLLALIGFWATIAWLVWIFAPQRWRS